MQLCAEGLSERVADVDITVADAEQLGVPLKDLPEIHIGKESMKQYLAAAALLQQVQHNMLFGDLTAPRITQGNMVKLDFLRIKRQENEGKMSRYIDAAACAYFSFRPFLVHLKTSACLLIVRKAGFSRLLQRCMPF